MSKNMRWVALVLAINVGSSVAREFRAPYITQPFSHDFDPCDDEGFRYTVYSTPFCRQAHRAFTKHGTATKHLTALFFNEDEFRVTKFFPNAQVPHNTQYYNPYMRTMKIKPRAYYNEQGMHIGASVDRTVWRDRGRLGMRLNVPFKSVEIEKKGQALRRDSDTADVVQRRFNVASGDGNDPGYAIRLDFVEALSKNIQNNPGVKYDPAASIRILNATPVKVDDTAFVYSPEGAPPVGTMTGVQKGDLSTSTLPTSLDGLAADTLYIIDTTAKVYEGLDDGAAASVADRVAMQDRKATVWVSTVHPDGGGRAEYDYGTDIERRLRVSNANVYEWLHDRGYDFESNRRVGLGDIDVEFFYEHMLSDRFTVELCAKAKLPTATGNDYAGNPYRAHLGNGEHFEVGGGLRFGGELFSWLHLNLDGSYMFALEGKEHRCAAPTGSLIRNIGPTTDAEVSWSTVVANADLTVVHPQTNDLTMTVGYQFMYKDQDKINYKLASVDSWLGKIYDTSAHTYSVTNTMTIDGKLLAKNTERYAHRAKANMTYHFSDWFAMSLGGAFTFAGQNAPKSLDWFCHCSATF